MNLCLALCCHAAGWLVSFASVPPSTINLSLHPSTHSSSYYYYCASSHLPVLHPSSSRACNLGLPCRLHTHSSRIARPLTSTISYHLTSLDLVPLACYHHFPLRYISQLLLQPFPPVTLLLSFSLPPLPASLPPAGPLLSVLIQRCPILSSLSTDAVPQHPLSRLRALLA